MRYQKADLSFAVYEALEGIKIDFIRDRGHSDLISLRQVYMVEDKSLLQFSSDIKDLLNSYCPTPYPAFFTGYESNSIVVANADAMIVLTRDRHRVDEVIKLENIEVDILAAPDIAEKIAKYLDKLYSSNKYAKVYWWYASKDGPTSIFMSLNDPHKVYNEFYPWILPGVDEYFTKYLESDAPLLFLSGQAGTGKTSFLRHCICKNNLTTYVGYDHKLFDSDEMFIAFISATDTKVMIMEDAENIVVPRKRAGDSMMTRFLNVSDGLIKFPGKKIIFTTNESSFENTDSALVRPGRCFDALSFRKLTGQECRVASKRAGLPLLKDDASHSLAELFNPTTKIIETMEDRFGFH